MAISISYDGLDSFHGLAENVSLLKIQGIRRFPNLQSYRIPTTGSIAHQQAYNDIPNAARQRKNFWTRMHAGTCQESIIVLIAITIPNKASSRASSD